MDNTSGLYNPEWTNSDAIAFNRVLIEEKEVNCHWIDNWTVCNDPVKGKDFRTHLHHKHGITSDSPLYSCRWHECSSQPMKRSSLERHMREQHIPVKWACPHCPQTFTRDTTLVEHLRRYH